MKSSITLNLSEGELLSKTFYKHRETRIILEKATHVRNYEITAENSSGSMSNRGEKGGGGEGERAKRRMVNELVRRIPRVRIQGEIRRSCYKKRCSIYRDVSEGISRRTSATLVRNASMKVERRLFLADLQCVTCVKIDRDL